MQAPRERGLFLFGGKPAGSKPAAGAAVKGGVEAEKSSDQLELKFKRFKLAVKKINARKVINGKFPDFSGSLHPDYPEVVIEYTGRRSGRGGDFWAANMAAGIRGSKPPDGYTWPHTEDVYLTEDGRVIGRMQLVKMEIHEEENHTGGVAIYEEITGREYVK